MLDICRAFKSTHVISGNLSKTGTAYVRIGQLIQYDCLIECISHLLSTAHPPMPSGLMRQDATVDKSGPKVPFNQWLVSGS